MADQNDTIANCVKILRRLPPKDIENDLVRISCLVDPDLEDELWQRVDLPLKVKLDKKAGKEYIVCDYNRDGDSYRSPWSNEYFPPIEEGLKPEGELRRLEDLANKIFDVYRRQYFTPGRDADMKAAGVSSVYMWDMGKSNFAAAFLIKKPVKAGDMEASWNSIHVVEANRKTDTSFSYKVTSTVIVDIQVDNETIGNVNLNGSSSDSQSKTLKVANGKDAIASHIANIGPMIENLEKQLRDSIEGVYFGRTNSVQAGMRVVDVVQRKARNKLAEAAVGMAKKHAN